MIALAGRARACYDGLYNAFVTQPFCMPLLAIATLLIDLACAIHVGRTGRPMYWMYLIFMLPGVGALAYVAVEVVPELVGSPRGQRAVRTAARMIDPGKAYRALRDVAEEAPTVDNLRRLAEECLTLGRWAEARDLYRRCLVGLHAGEPDLLLGLARAEFGGGQAGDAVATLDRLRAANPDFQSADGHMLYARALEGAGDRTAALREYEALAGYFSGPEARCRLALLLRQMGESARAAEILAGVARQLDRSPRHVRARHREWHDLARRGLGP